MHWSGLMRARNITVLATATLGFLGVIGNPDQIWVWILAFICAFVIVWKNWSKSNRLGQSYGFVLGRVLSLIADLSSLAGSRFDLWAVDLYLPRNSFTVFPPTRICKLELALHIALTDVRTVPNKIEIDHVFFGRCFTEGRSALWWNPTLAPTSEENGWERLDDSDNNQIRTEYGVISINPVIDNLREDCRGLLVIHAARDAEIVTKVLSVLTQPEGKRRVAAACVDIHNYLRTS